VRCCVGPRQEIVDLAVGMAVDDLGDDVGEIGVGFDIAQLAGFDQRGDDKAFFRLRAIGRMVRSTILESISMRPSSRKRVKPSQRESA
jgi:hypothetical protein